MIKLKKIVREQENPFFDEEGNPRINRINGFASGMISSLETNLEKLEQFKLALNKSGREADAETLKKARSLRVKIGVIETAMNALISALNKIFDITDFERKEK